MESGFENIVSDIAVTLSFLLWKLEIVWQFFNDYPYWRTGFLVVVNYLFAWSLSKEVPYLIVKISSRLNFELGEKLAGLIGSFIFRLLFLIGLGLILNVSGLFNEQISFISAILLTLIIFSAYLFGTKLTKIILSHMARGGDEKKQLIQPKTLPIFEYTSIVIWIMLGIYASFKVWNIEMTALLASAGVAGFAISIAAKDTLSDIISGVLILTDAPFQLGDVIEVKGEVGEITQIGLRSTRIMTAQNVEIVIPNGILGATEIINKSVYLMDHLLIKLPVKAAYGVDPRIIRTILTSAAEENADVLNEEPITVVLEEFNQAQTTFILICYIKEASLRLSTIWALREDIYMRFLEQNIEVALPEREEVTISQLQNFFNQSGTPRKLPDFKHIRKIQ